MQINQKLLCRFFVLGLLQPLTSCKTVGGSASGLGSELAPLLGGGLFDEVEDGLTLKGISAQLRELVAKYPAATFVPGHGGIVKSKEVLEYADYLDSIKDAVDEALALRLSSEDAWATYDAKRWPRRVLPSTHLGSLKWATAKTSFISAYQIGQREEKLAMLKDLQTK